MAYTTIDDPSAFFQTATYTGTGNANNAITNDGNSNLQPDFIWFKSRDSGHSHYVVDSSRGRDKGLYTDVTNTEVTSSGSTTDCQSFDTDGFTVGTPEDANSTNSSSSTKVAWQWKANGGTTASNSDGDLTSTTQFNSTAKFSIITYTGKDPIEPLDIGHGMGEAPDVFWVKNRDRAANWGVYHKDLTSPAENRNLKLNLPNAEAAESTFWRNEAPTSTIIKTGENASVNVANEKFVVYAWKEVQGFSKFGKYTGNGNANGTFVYTGFKPACVITKEISGSGGNWRIFDNARAGFNEDNYRLTPNEASAESTAVHLDLLSNGFKFRNTGTSYNGSGDTYIYMAWAENPFVTSTGIPTTAR
tara:strand:- start:97 stop:1176 length:1080 start_codon:yes stop_codon:yes gene_type:complete